MSEQRKYTIDEIDEMRRSLDAMRPNGHVSHGREWEAGVEDRLRTHMLNGTEPADLKERAKAYIAWRLAEQMKEQASYKEFIRPAFS